MFGRLASTGGTRHAAGCTGVWRDPACPLPAASWRTRPLSDTARWCTLAAYFLTGDSLNATLQHTHTHTHGYTHGTTRLFPPLRCDARAARVMPHTRTYTHARTHTRTHAHTHAHARARAHVAPTPRPPSAVSPAPHSSYHDLLLANIDRQLLVWQDGRTLDEEACR